MTLFSGVNIKLFCLMLGTVTFTFLLELNIKILVLDSFSENLFALSQLLSNCSSLFLTQDIFQNDICYQTVN